MPSRGSPVSPYNVYGREEKDVLHRHKKQVKVLPMSRGGGETTGSSPLFLKNGRTFLMKEKPSLAGSSRCKIGEGEGV